MNNDEAGVIPVPVELRFGEFRLDRVGRTLRRADASEVELGPRLFDALLFFVEHPGRLLDKDTLLAALWPGQVVEENNVNQVVLALRRALGDDAQASRYIQTVPRRGFRFVATVTGVAPQAEPIVESAAQHTAEPTAEPAAPARRARLLFVVAAALALAVFAVAASFWLPPWRGATPSTALTSLAVLPFKPLALDGRDAVLELGMADSLIVRMSSLPGLVVRSIGSARRYAGPEQDPLRAARELDVQWILDGSVQRRGDRIRVTARLLKAADGSAVWSGSFDDDFKDVFTVQDRISERVAAVLAPRLAATDRSRLTFSGTRNADAYQFYLTARYHAQALSTDGLRLSVELYERATRADPAYALAYAGLVNTYRAMAIGIDALPAQIFEPAQRAAARAMELDPALADAHAALGWVRWWYDWDWPGAEQSFRRAIELNPNLSDAQLGLGHLLCSRQRCDEGFAHVRRSRELDPMSLIANVIEASYLLQRGARDESRERVDGALRIAPRFWPAHQFLAALHFSAGDPDKAIDELRIAQSLADRSAQPTAHLGAVLARSGRPEAAREMLQKLLALGERRYVPPTLVASVYCALGSHAQALDWLDKAQAVRDVNLPFLTVCSVELAAEPRFRALLDKARLPAWSEGFCAPLQAPAVGCRN